MSGTTVAEVPAAWPKGSRPVAGVPAVVSSGRAGSSNATVTRLAALPGVSTASRVAAAGEHARSTGQVLPVLPALSGFLPWGGLRRGSTVAVRGATSLLFALLAEATSAGAWAAVVGVPRFGVAAAGEFGVRTDRLAFVPRPGADFASVTAALLDGVDLVVAGPPGRFGDTRTARRLSTRARGRGAVLLSLGPWPGADVELRCTPVRLSGLRAGHGYLREREVVVDVAGRGAAAKPVRSSLLLPGEAGAVTGGSEGAAVGPSDMRQGVRAG
ncbi:hypothetical protein BAY61_03275 [Prauserella marina]|uniref:Uncharacterized protein n=1 Tax=Prauserella marina TaxID=530584 RepID=A0A222VJU6_9PSEU|nr:hypothetical protein [Prauserella marina]ASR34177.1 hypothetical protein BAY61_03275 [Prauserella marina]PWV70511.1 hypothetical protein DES30_11616 [Prauserella marina]SDE03655.1 hypothetical protein SAMN05421630_11910 [Prauserella marina]